LLPEVDVTSVSGTTSAFTHGFSRNGYKIDGEHHSAYVYGVDPAYIETLDIKLILGRNFSADIPGDRDAVIVNEALVRDMKWDDPLGEYLNWKNSIGMGAKVIGVVKDFHFQSLGYGIDPMFLSMDTAGVGYPVSMLVRVTPGDLRSRIELLQRAFGDIAPNSPFEYSFLDDDVDKQYDAHRRWMKITSLSTTFAMVISCLGLFGLAGVNAVNRTKEVGIRKVMGAGIFNILVLLNRQYVWLAAIAFVIAMPVAWYVMQQWLREFQFSVAIGWELFVLSMAAGIVIALATVSYHALKAARINPVETLKYE
jgi:putative ABC transport system permease protein